jgi:hypothetical protein
MIIKMPGRRVMPSSYCNDLRNYIHLSKHIVKNAPRTNRSLIHGCFNGFTNSYFHKIQEIDYDLMGIFYEIRCLSVKEKREFIETYLKTGRINWKLFDD